MSPKRTLTSSKKPEDISAQDYLAIYYTGGHGVIWDFPDNQALQDIALTIYEQGGFATSVCHGLASLLNVQDRSGYYLLAGKQVTGFSKWEKVPFIIETEAGC